MLFWIIQVTFLSIIFIFVLHSLIHFFKTTLTVPKIKDLVNTPQEKYKKIFDLLQNASFEKQDPYKENPISQKVINDKSSADMKNELKNFLKSQISSENSSTPITSLDTINNANYYAYN
jgi:hypothetical protein